MKFAYLLENYRERKKISATDLALRLDFSPGYINNIENGHRPPPKIPICERIADALDLSTVEKALFINAAMEERLDQDEIQWVESRAKSSSGVRESTVPYSNIPKEILEALEDPMAVKALLTTHKNKKDIKEAIIKCIELFPKMDQSKRMAILSLCQ